MENNKEELVITRVFDAQTETLWRYFSEPELFKKWWGPKNFTCPVANIDFKVGGKAHVAMHGPEGSEFDKDFWSTGVYKAIIPTRKIVVTDSFADEKGNVVPASYYGMSEDFPEEMLITIIFEELGDQTKLTLRHAGIAGINPTDRQNMEQGWNESFDKLEESLK